MCPAVTVWLLGHGAVPSSQGRAWVTQVALGSGYFLTSVEVSHPGIFPSGKSPLLKLSPAVPWRRQGLWLPNRWRET